MGAAAPAIMIAGAAYSAYSAYQQGKLAKAAAARNEKIARQAEADALARGELEASRVRSAGVREMAKAKATMLAQGQHAEGAGLQDLLLGMALNIETDAETVRNNAAREAWGLRNQADTARFEGAVAAKRAEQEMLGSLLGGAGGAAQYSAKLDGLKKAGA